MNSNFHVTTTSLITALFFLLISGASAQEVQFNFLGNAGSGLLPGNEVPPIPPGMSEAFGDEILDGIVYDTATGVLSLAFDFEQLTDGVADVSGGIHLHRAAADDPFNTNGPADFLLNEGGVNVPFGSTSGKIDLDVTLTPDDEAALFNNQYYINIHTVAFGIGELRANLVPDILLGDINRDGALNLLDVAPFIALVEIGGFQLEADINQDGVVNLLDVQPFVELLSG